MLDKRSFEIFFVANDSIQSVTLHCGYVRFVTSSTRTVSPVEQSLTESLLECLAGGPSGIRIGLCGKQFSLPLTREQYQKLLSGWKEHSHNYHLSSCWKNCFAHQADLDCSHSSVVLWKADIAFHERLGYVSLWERQLALMLVKQLKQLK